MAEWVLNLIILYLIHAGKTSLIQRFAKDTYTDEYKKTYLFTISSIISVFFLTAVHNWRGFFGKTVLFAIAR